MTARNPYPLQTCTDVFARILGTGIELTLHDRVPVDPDEYTEDFDQYVVTLPGGTKVWVNSEDIIATEGGTK